MEENKDSLSMHYSNEKHLCNSQIVFPINQLRKQLALSKIERIMETRIIKDMGRTWRSIQIQDILKLFGDIPIARFNTIEHGPDSEFEEFKSNLFKREKSVDYIKALPSSSHTHNLERSSSLQQHHHPTIARKEQLLHQIVEKLQPLKNMQNKQQRIFGSSSHINQRLFKLQKFMDQIKRQRKNEKTSVILERRKIIPINYHWLADKLREQRQRSQVNDKYSTIFQQIGRIRNQITDFRKLNHQLLQPKQSICELQLSKNDESINKKIVIERLNDEADESSFDVQSGSSNFQKWYDKFEKQFPLLMQAQISKQSSKENQKTQFAQLKETAKFSNRKAKVSTQ